MNKLTELNSWKALEDKHKEISSIQMKDLFENDIDRFNKFSIQFEDILFDYSKNLIDSATLDLLINLADERGLKSWIDRMFSGDKINSTEKRAVLHTALRNYYDNEIIVDGRNVKDQISKVNNKIKEFVLSVHTGDWKGYSGKKIDTVVNIGIGGSHLGPELVCSALKPYADKNITAKFIANVDASDMIEKLHNIDYETTLFIIASKTFTTQETMTNAHSVRQFFLDSVQNEDHISKHFIAISTNIKACREFGIPEENVFGFWDWVGGRYSLWSAIGMPIALTVGFDKFEELLRGAFTMDKHFKETPFKDNIPVILALIGIWNINFLNAATHAIIPYDNYLNLLPDFIQQLDMESNGKSIDREGKKVDYMTGPVIWGTIGTNSQHSFFQLIHQGTQLIPVDFLAPLENHNKVGNHHTLLLSNMFAQAEALMKGKTENEVQNELLKNGMSYEDINLLLPHKVFCGNKPNNTILYKKLSPFILGMLLAMYEHKVFVQGIIWNLNSFDQWGVELGKMLALNIQEELASNNTFNNHDSSTKGLIDYFLYFMYNRIND